MLSQVLHVFGAARIIVLFLENYDNNHQQLLLPLKNCYAFNIIGKKYAIRIWYRSCCIRALSQQHGN